MNSFLLCLDSMPFDSLHQVPRTSDVGVDIGEIPSIHTVSIQAAIKVQSFAGDPKVYDRPNFSDRAVLPSNTTSSTNLNIGQQLSNVGRSSETDNEPTA